MANPVGYFEIAVTDIERAIRFYAAVFDFDFERGEIHGIQMAYFPFHHDAKGITGALAQGESYVPGHQGCRVYFTTTSITDTLKRAEEAGGKILFPKTLVSDEIGWSAELEDSEGNCIGLNEPPSQLD